MKRSSVLSIVGLSLLVIGVGLAGGFGYRTLKELRSEVAGLRSSVAGLQGDLAESERRAEAARSRADDAEQRADQAEDLSQRLAERARAAEEQARTAQGEARTAKTEAASALTQAERAAEVQRQAIVDRARAEQEAAAVKERLDRVRAQKQRQLDRLERTLGKIAETRRTALGMVMNLGDSIEFDFDKADLRPENREILSRIAGVLLTAEDVGIQVYGHTDDVGSVEYNREALRAPRRGGPRVPDRGRRRSEHHPVQGLRQVGAPGRRHRPGVAPAQPPGRDRHRPDHRLPAGGLRRRAAGRGRHGAAQRARPAVGERAPRRQERRATQGLWAARRRPRVVPGPRVRARSDPSGRSPRCRPRRWP